MYTIVVFYPLQLIVIVRLWTYLEDWMKFWSKLKRRLVCVPEETWGLMHESWILGLYILDSLVKIIQSSRTPPTSSKSKSHSEHFADVLLSTWVKDLYLIPQSTVLCRLHKQIFTFQLFFVIVFKHASALSPMIYKQPWLCLILKYVL